MKPHKITTVLITLALVLVSCTDNFDKLNRKPYQVDNEELQREGYIIGSTLKGMQGLVVPTQEHLYQFIEALAAGPFAGYFGATVAWTDKFETYNPPVDWQNKTFSDVFTKTYPFYRDILNFTDDPVAVALAKLMRVAIMHRMTDMYGPIPYSKVLADTEGESLAVAYDTQEEVYRRMLVELDEVSAVIKALMHRDSTRGLSNGERKMLHIAKQILVSEIVLAEDVEYPEAEGRVNAAMLLKESD